MSIDTWLETSRDRHLDELKALLRIPSVSTDPSFAPEVRRCADHVVERLTEIGLTARRYDTPGHPIVYGEWLGAPGAPTVLIYGHYDVQPADPIELWRNPPFEPTVEGGNLVARGATDDKGQFYCHVKGAEAWMKTQGRLPVNVKFLIEGEEESGSTSLDDFLSAHAEMLRADAVVISDSSMHAPGRPAILYGLRGLAYLEVHVKGPSHDLHSGMFGGAVRNPINALASMIAQLHDASGRIAVPGFYDRVRPLSAEERAGFRELAHDEVEFRRELGIEDSPGEEGYTVLERITSRPTLDCNGIWGGYTAAGAKTVLPSEAHAKISCRLVPDQEPEEIAARVRDHLRSIAPSGVTVEVELHHGGAPVLVSRDSETVGAAFRAFERVWGVRPVFTRGGGSIPVVASFRRILGLDAVLMGYGLSDDRLHSPNEKFGLENYFNGIRTSAYLLEELGRR